MSSDEQIIEGLADVLADGASWEDHYAPGRLARSVLDYLRTLGWTAPDEWEEVKVYVNQWGDVDLENYDTGSVDGPAQLPTLYRRRTEGVAE